MFKVGATVRVTVNQQRDPASPQVLNGTRGRILEVPVGFFPPERESYTAAQGVGYMLMSRFFPILTNDTQFPITIQHEKNPNWVSRIGCIDQFIPLGQDEPDDWQKRTYQLCLRYHPCRLNYADTPGGAIGTELTRGVIDMASCSDKRAGGGPGLFYIALSRFTDLNKVWLVNYDEGAIVSDAQAWMLCKASNKVTNRMNYADMSRYYEMDAPHLRLKTAIPDDVFRKLSA
jgi:hypothetical protein